jgi:tetratricopeptide (TPR) repeat protein
MLVHHLLSAIEYARASGEPADDLRPAAMAALHEAGERAASVHALAAAVRYFEQAIDLVPAGEQADPHLLFQYGYAQQVLGSPRPDVLEEAGEIFLAAGDPDAAAQCEYTLGWISWQTGDRDNSWRHWDRAAELVDVRRSTPETAFVLSHLSRANMLAGRFDEAIAYGERALALAEDLGLTDLLGATLNNVGVSRASKGDASGLELIERSLEIGLERGSSEGVRSYTNLATMEQQLGDQRRAAELHELGLERARQLGTGGYQRWLECERVQDLYFAGRWKDALDEAGSLLAAEHHVQYMNIELNLARGCISYARGNVEVSLHEIDLALDRARAIMEPQALFRTLAVAAHLHALAGRRDEATALVGELDRARSVTSREHVDWWPFHVAAALHTLGRSDDLEELLEGVTASRWVDAARAHAASDFARAADILDEIGSAPDEALARLRAAEVLAAEGRDAEALEQLDRATAFFSDVDATAWLLEAETLAASLRAAAS